MQRQKEHELVVTEGPNVGERYLLLDMVSTLGRASDNTVVLESSQISRHHAQIRLLPGGAIIEDMGSTNGTFINNRRLVEPHTLSAGDHVRFADFVTFEYVVHEQPASTVVAGSTQAMDEPPGFRTPPQPTQQSYQGPEDVELPSPFYPQQPIYEQPLPPVGYNSPVYNAPAASPAEEPRAPRRSRGLYIIIGVLVVLICLCIALAVYLWFAPLSFWERVFDLLGIPLPSGALHGLILRW